MNNRQLPNQFQSAQLQLFLREPQGTPRKWGGDRGNF